jgi:quinol monooxygenase YgiN
MYGTVARFRVKPGMETEFMKLNQEFEAASAPGEVAGYVFRLDNDPNECYLVAVFESKEAYHANAASPEQDAMYRKFRALLEADPEWHDGEIVFTYNHS